MLNTLVGRKLASGTVVRVDATTLTKEQRAAVESAAEWIKGETIRPQFVDLSAGGENFRVSVYT